MHGGRNGTGTGVSLDFFYFTLLIMIPPLLDTHQSESHDACNSPDHVPQTHSLGLGVSSLTQHLATYCVKKLDLMSVRLHVI
jgi:hypothetical protein